MIGQQNIKNIIKGQVENESFPRFSIIVGPYGSGKKQLCKYIATKLGATLRVCGTSVDAVRNMITESYKVSIPMLYLIPDADTMSIAARNALLKITEEPPKTAYFIMTLTDINNTLPTLKSRASVFTVDTYSVPELNEYIDVKTNYAVSKEVRSILLDLCENPGEINYLLDIDTEKFYDYVLLVVDKIAEVSGTNSFKIGSKIKFKEADTGYDLRMFLKAFSVECSRRLLDDVERYSYGVFVTAKYIQDLRNKSINKQFTFDLWMLDIRRGWLK